MRTAPHRRGAARRAALLLTAALLVTACTADRPPPPVRPADSGALVGAAASQSRAAELQAGLTHLLVERVYVTAFAGRAGAADPALADARGVLDANSQALAEVLGATYFDARRRLLAALRAGDTAHLVHAAAVASGDTGAAARTRAALEQAQVELGAVVGGVVPGMSVERVTTRLKEDLEAQLVGQAGPTYPALRTAAGRAVDTATLLAGAVAADRELGPTGTRAATLRAELTALFTEHVLLVGALARELAAPREGTGAAAASARAALDDNADALSTTLGGAYPAAAGPFLAAWTDHLARVEAYAQGVAAAGAAPSGELRTAPGTLGRLLAQHIGGLSAARLTTDLTPWLDTLLRAVDAAATGSPKSPSALRRAVADAPPPAAVLAAATAEHLRLR